MPNLNPLFFGADNYLVDLGVKSVVNTDLLSGDVSGWYDTRGQLGLNVTIIGSAGITAGAITFEQTNDPTNAPSGFTLPYVDASTVSPAPLSGPVTVTANSTKHYYSAITARYIRIRISTAFAGGTIRAIAALTDDPPELAPVNVPVSVTTGSISNTDNIFWNDSTTNQTASATLTGTARDVGVAAATNHRFSAFNAFVIADQTGTLRIECSNDNTTWRRASADSAVAVNVPVYLSVPVMTRYYRAVYVNGAAATTVFSLNTSLTAA